MNKPKTRLKLFHVDYLPILIEDKLGNIENLDLLPWIELLNKEEVKKRVSYYNGEVCRLQKIEYINSLIDNLSHRKIWRFEFIRIKTHAMTGVANEDGAYDPEYIANKLADKEYLAEPTTCLYDEEFKILIIARNRDGVLPSGILEFLKKKTGINSLKLGILPTKTTFSKANSNIYRTISIGINNLDKLDNNSKSFLEKRCTSVFGAIRALEPYANINLKLNLSMGKASKNKGMNQQKVNEELQALIESDIKNISKLELASRADEDTKVETIDLLSDKVHDNFVLSVSKEDIITHERQYRELLNSYNKLYTMIEKII